MGIIVVQPARVQLQVHLARRAVLRPASVDRPRHLVDDEPPLAGLLQSDLCCPPSAWHSAQPIQASSLRAAAWASATSNFVAAPRCTIDGAGNADPAVRGAWPPGRGADPARLTVTFAQDDRRTGLSATRRGARSDRQAPRRAGRAPDRTGGFACSAAWTARQGQRWRGASVVRGSPDRRHASRHASRSAASKARAATSRSLVRRPGSAAAELGYPASAQSSSPSARESGMRTRRRRILGLAGRLPHAHRRGPDPKARRGRASPCASSFLGGPGGVTDIRGACWLADRLTPALGQPVVMETAAGAGGNSGTVAGARQRAQRRLHAGHHSYRYDGNQSAHLANPGYDPLTDLAPITRLGVERRLWLSREACRQFAWRSLARSWPAPFRPSSAFNSPGVGTPGHLASSLLMHLTGIQRDPYLLQERAARPRSTWSPGTWPGPSRASLS